MSEELDNAVWNSLNGHQRRFSEGNAKAKRFARGFSPIVGFPKALQPDFAALRPFCDVGERMFCVNWIGEPPADIALSIDTVMCQMVFEGTAGTEDTAPEAVPLTGEHAQQALDLALLTKPGPFGLRTIELGEYFGIFDGPKLLAMAGERMHVGNFREVSGVCTHPDAQGQGLAKRLLKKVLHRELTRGETPWLHVYSHNKVAVELYGQLGFRVRRESPVRVIEFTR